MGDGCSLACLPTLRGPATPDEVLQKLVRGEVKLYRFTVPEGLRADEIAQVVGATGLCDAAAFLKLARDGAAAKSLGVPADSLEGFLFPDTYSVTRAAGCKGIAQAMVARFRAAWEQAEAQRLPSVKLTQLQAVTLASIIEKETGQPDERPRISCVFHNRLKKGWRLGTDPTVIYSILLLNDFRWDGKIHKRDLERPHPYNTYVSFGLPPGPIANPGEAALAAALHPMACGDFYFVSKNDHTHVFCPDAACHQKNVQKWQIDFFKKGHRAPAALSAPRSPTSAVPEGVPPGQETIRSSSDGCGRNRQAVAERLTGCSQTDRVHFRTVQFQRRRTPRGAARLPRRHR